MPDYFFEKFDPEKEAEVAGKTKKLREEAKQREAEARQAIPRLLDELNMESIFGGSKRKLKEAEELKSQAWVNEQGHKATKEAGLQRFVQENQTLKQDLDEAEQKGDLVAAEISSTKLQLLWSDAPDEFLMELAQGLAEQREDFSVGDLYSRFVEMRNTARSKIKEIMGFEKPKSEDK